MKFIDIRERMKEAICSDTQELIMLVSTTPQEGIYAYEEVQRLVRCKDCRFYIEDSSTCWHFGHCELVGFSVKRVSSDVEVEPDGFCAWGERKVVEEKDGERNPLDSLFKDTDGMTPTEKVEYLAKWFKKIGAE